jgi:hypothetical protein
VNQYLNPRDLTWDDVDPAGHRFNAESAALAVRSLGPARCVPACPDVGVLDPAMRAWNRDAAEPWAEAMSYALVERFGRWAIGWRWGRGESDFDGGPVGNWCCVGDSVTTPEETLDRVVASLCEWRGWLESLAEWFDAYPLDLVSIEDDRIVWENAARKLILHTADRTGGESGWYGHCRQVLTWFLSRWGVAPETGRELVERAIGGRFKSWTSPDAVLVDDVAERLALSLRPDGGPWSDEGVPDHLLRWLEVREAVRWHDAPPTGTSTVGPGDAAAEYIRAFDGAIDPVRADGLLAALALMRADAASGAPLDFEMLRGWQRHVLGVPEPPPFRTLPAFAKDGRERYGIAPDTLDRLDACLAESRAGSGPVLPLTARAARAYLDVCFFHPFDDGNSRSAFLALLFVLAREGIAPSGVGLLRRFGVRADDPQDALVLTRFIATGVTAG